MDIDVLIHKLKHMPKSNNYSDCKNYIRALAIEWQYEFAESNYSYFDLAKCHEIFMKYGRRYGLLREFRENGIC